MAEWLPFMFTSEFCSSPTGTYIWALYDVTVTAVLWLLHCSCSCLFLSGIQVRLRSSPAPAIAIYFVESFSMGICECVCTYMWVRDSVYVCARVCVTCVSLLLEGHNPLIPNVSLEALVMEIYSTLSIAKALCKSKPQTPFFASTLQAP